MPGPYPERDEYVQLPNFLENCLGQLFPLPAAGSRWGWERCRAIISKWHWTKLGFITMLYGRLLWKMSGMFGRGLFKACGWKWQFLTILHLLSEQNVGTMHPLRLKQKNTHLLAPATAPSGLSNSIHMGSHYSFHARLLTLHSSIRLAAILWVFL